MYKSYILRAFSIKDYKTAFTILYELANFVQFKTDDDKELLNRFDKSTPNEQFNIIRDYWASLNNHIYTKALEQKLITADIQSELTVEGIEAFGD
jgi:hypothetical protein